MLFSSLRVTLSRIRLGFAVLKMLLNLTEQGVLSKGGLVTPGQSLRLVLACLFPLLFFLNTIRPLTVGLPGVWD